MRRLTRALTRVTASRLLLVRKGNVHASATYTRAAPCRSTHTCGWHAVHGRHKSTKECPPASILTLLAGCALSVCLCCALLCLAGKRVSGSSGDPEEAAGSQPSRVITRVIPNPHQLLLGFTATPYRRMKRESEDLYAILRPTYTASISTMIRNNYLTEVIRGARGGASWVQGIHAAQDCVEAARMLTSPRCSCTTLRGC